MAQSMVYLGKYSMFILKKCTLGVNILQMSIRSSWLMLWFRSFISLLNFYLLVLSLLIYCMTMGYFFLAFFYASQFLSAEIVCRRTVEAAVNNTTYKTEMGTFFLSSCHQYGCSVSLVSHWTGFDFVVAMDNFSASKTLNSSSCGLLLPYAQL